MLGDVSGLVTAIAALVTALCGLFAGFKWGQSSGAKRAVEQLKVRDERAAKE